VIKIKKEMFASIVTQLFSEKNGTLETISNDVINKIMTDIDIASAIQIRKSSIRKKACANS
jgi:hypothetical protein